LLIIAALVVLISAGKGHDHKKHHKSSSKSSSSDSDHHHHHHEKTLVPIVNIKKGQPHCCHPKKFIDVTHKDKFTFKNIPVKIKLTLHLTSIGCYEEIYEKNLKGVSWLL